MNDKTKEMSIESNWYTFGMCENAADMKDWYIGIDANCVFDSVGYERCVHNFTLSVRRI